MVDIFCHVITLQFKMSKFFLVFFYFVGVYALTPSGGFDQLVAGNQRFQKGKTISLNQDLARGRTLKCAQAPFAVVVACSDSRVAPELLFDQGIGDLFVIRVAGNVVGPLEMESIEYAVKHLGSSCILVMGHENCGAVNAVVTGQTADVRYIAQIIKPAVIKAQAAFSKNLLESSIKFNAELVSKFVQQSSIVSGLMSQGKLGVRAAYYNFDNGAVELL